MSDKTLEAIIAERNERLEQLIRVLDEVEKLERPFDLEDWFADDPHDCESAACAIGWACRDPWFQERGLIGRTDACFPLPVLLLSGDSLPRAVGNDAVAKFFHLHLETAIDLVSPKQDYHSPAHVKAAIRSLLGDKRRLACFE